MSFANDAIDTARPSFLLCRLRRELQRANGRKMTARELTTALGMEPGPWDTPSGAMMGVIMFLAQLEERGEIRSEMPTASVPSITHWIDPVDPKCATCGVKLSEHGARCQ